MTEEETPNFYEIIIKSKHSLDNTWLTELIKEFNLEYEIKYYHTVLRYEFDYRPIRMDDIVYTYYILIDSSNLKQLFARYLIEEYKLKYKRLDKLLKNEEVDDDKEKTPEE